MTELSREDAEAGGAGMVPMLVGGFALVGGVTVKEYIVDMPLWVATLIFSVVFMGLRKVYNDLADKHNDGCGWLFSQPRRNGRAHAKWLKERQERAATEAD
ncbi:MAG: hypothetical protein JJE52_13545 [Acidimicrobiia bacterium]|nr:hypothetical protein [Acidimicrobiia bacterium]